MASIGIVMYFVSSFKKKAKTFSIDGMHALADIPGFCAGLRRPTGEIAITIGGSVNQLTQKAGMTFDQFTNP